MLIVGGLAAAVSYFIGLLLSIGRMIFEGKSYHILATNDDGSMTPAC